MNTPPPCLASGGAGPGHRLLPGSIEKLRAGGTVHCLDCRVPVTMRRQGFHAYPEKLVGHAQP